jgi:outer membrane protein OmpA-like peptidoglycan-associated protein
VKTAGGLNPRAGARYLREGRRDQFVDGLFAKFIGTARAAQEGLAMSRISGRRNLAAIVSLLTIGAVLSFGVAKAVAGDEVTEDQIVKALAPPAKKPLTRGLSVGPQTQTDPAATAAEGRFVQTIRNRTTRSLSITEREEIATIAKDKPNIDLEINFDYNSADISTKSLSSVQALGKALTNPDLKGSTFVVAGYTDAAGTDAYNQDLSERRADSIKHYLTDKFGITGTDLVTVGYGKTKLKDPSNPLADVNRRVQVVNMANKTTASK